MSNYLYKFVFDTNTLEVRSDRQIDFEVFSRYDAYTLTIANKGKSNHEEESWSQELDVPHASADDWHLR